MSWHRAVVIFALLATPATPMRAQESPPSAAALPARFESWRPGAPFLVAGTALDRRPVAAPRHRAQNALLGGAIGAAAGIVFCTAVSTLANDSADGGLSFCPLDSCLLIGGAGFVLGFGIGWIA